MVVTPGSARILLRNSGSAKAKPPASSIRTSHSRFSGFIYILFRPFLSLPRISLRPGTALTSLTAISKPLATSEMALSRVSITLNITRGLASSLCLSIVMLANSGRPEAMISSYRAKPSENNIPSKLPLASDSSRKAYLLPVLLIRF